MSKLTNASNFRNRSNSKKSMMKLVKKAMTGYFTTLIQNEDCWVSKPLAEFCQIRLLHCDCLVMTILVFCHSVAHKSWLTWWPMAMQSQRPYSLYCKLTDTICLLQPRGIDLHLRALHSLIPEALSRKIKKILTKKHIRRRSMQVPVNTAQAKRMGSDKNVACVLKISILKSWIWDLFRKHVGSWKCQSTFQKRGDL